MARVVAPVDQAYADAADAVSVTEPPAQNVVAPAAVIDGVAAVAVVTSTGADAAEQPALVTVTEYEPGWLTAIDCVVAPLDQLQLLPLAAVSVTLWPGQSAVGPEAVTVVSTAATGTTCSRILGQPSCATASRTVTLETPG